MDINTVRGIFTIVMLITFIILIFWAFSPKRKASFEEAAKIPFTKSNAESDNKLNKLDDNHE